MSDHGHEHPDESGKNRTYLSLFVVAVGLATAMGIGLASPTARVVPARHAPELGKRGVVVVEAPAPDAPATVLYGTVLERGAALHVITPTGERVVPRARARAWQVETDQLGADYFERFPLDAFPLQGLEPQPAAAEPRAAAAAAGDTSGVVVLLSGEVLVGRLSVEGAFVTVRWPTGAGALGETRVPRRAVRWMKEGVDAPTDEYYRQFPNAPLDPRYRRAEAPGGRLQAEAELAHSRGRWDEATRKWAELYRLSGGAASRQNLETCAHRWFASSLHSPEALAAHVDGLFSALDGLLDRPEAQQIAANSVYEAIRLSLDIAQIDAARAYARRLRELGPEYAAEGERMLRDLEGRGGPAPGHEGHDHD